MLNAYLFDPADLIRYQTDIERIDVDNSVDYQSIFPTRITNIRLMLRVMRAQISAHSSALHVHLVNDYSVIY